MFTYFLINWLSCYFRLDELVVLADFMFITFCLTDYYTIRVPNEMAVGALG